MFWQPKQEQDEKRQQGEGIIRLLFRSSISWLCVFFAMWTRSVIFSEISSCYRIAVSGVTSTHCFPRAKSTHDRGNRFTRMIDLWIMEKVDLGVVWWCIGLSSGRSSYMLGVRTNSRWRFGDFVWCVSTSLQIQAGRWLLFQKNDIMQISLGEISVRHIFSAWL